MSGAPHGATLEVRDVLRYLAAEQARAQVADPTATMKLVRLTQQEAVRRQWRERADPGDSDRTSGPFARTSQSCQLVVPWPGRPSVGLLTMSSTAGPLFPVLEVLFEACCATFHWTFEPKREDAERRRGHQDPT